LRSPERESKEKQVRKILSTSNDFTLTIARLALGIVFFAHGAQKMLGWFGGYGFTGTMGFFTQQMHIPAVFAFLAICAEFFGGLGLIVGLISRVAAFGIVCNMVVAVLTVHIHNGFFMNWTGQQKGEGFEFHVIALALLVVVLVKGAGALSIDRALSAREQ
jgi:putative oxidoreductase